MEFPKQPFENKVYELVVNLMNEYFAVPRSDSEVLKATRQMLQALHFVIEEEVVQVLYTTQLRAQLNKGGTIDEIL